VSGNCICGCCGDASGEPGVASPPPAAAAAADMDEEDTELTGLLSECTVSVCPWGDTTTSCALFAAALAARALASRCWL
jgi:hypothetical protein